MSEEIKDKTTKEQTGRKEFLSKYESKPGQQKPRRNIFDDYKIVNSFELDLPNTQNKLVMSLHQKKTDESDYLFKWQIGKSSMFIDGKIAFVVSTAMEAITDDIVPADLRPKMTMEKTN